MTTMMRNRFMQVPKDELKLAKKVDRWLQQNFEDEDDSSVAAQSAAGEFDHEEWLDDDTHWLWDLVAAWSEHFEESVSEKPAFNEMLMTVVDGENPERVVDGILRVQ